MRAETLSVYLCPFYVLTPIRAGTVSASVMLRKLAGFPRQNSVARALREIGRIERTLFMLDWFDDPEQRTGSILTRVRPATHSPAPSSSTASANCATAPSRTSAIVLPA